jgi:trimeric autotransporter adhesin
MSRTLDQIFIANPITTNVSTDLMYFSRSPYTPGNDCGMTYANFAAQFGTPFTPAALTEVNDTNVTMTLGGTPATALLQAVSMTLGWSGQLSLARGGTNAALTASNGGVFYSTASAGAILAGTPTADQVLLSGASGAPSWSTATYPATTTINQILFSSAANTISGITTLNNGVLTTSATGVPQFLANSGTAGFVLTANTGSPPSWQAVTADGAIGTIDGDSGSMTPTAGVVTISGGTTGLTTSASASTMNLTGTLNLAHGGTNASLTANNGGIFYSTASAGAILAGTATANQVLMSGASTTPAWSTATYPPTTTINQLLYSSAANVVGGITAANSAVLVSTSTGVPQFSGTMTNGQLIIGSTTATPTAATLTAGTGVTITNGAGSITIASSGADIWVDETGSSVTMTKNTGYTSDDGASLVTFTLPTTSAIGDWVEINGKGSGLWKIAQAAGQQINNGTSPTTLGTGGSLASVNQFDNVRLRCLTANTIWTVVSQQSSGLTVV